MSQEQPKAIFVAQHSYVPPLNFSLVEDGIYRSGFPMPINYPFLERLKLKTILYLGDLGCEKPGKKQKGEKKSSKQKEAKSAGKGEGSHADGLVKTPGPENIDKPKSSNGSSEILDNYKAWADSQNIEFHHLEMHSSQEPFILNTHKTVQHNLQIALQLMLNKNNFPILIHSNKGKHRTGVLVGLMRKVLQGWCMSGIFEEYEQFAMGKSEFDLEFIELWDPELRYDASTLPDFVRV